MPGEIVWVDQGTPIPEKSRSQKLREAGFVARDNSVQAEDGSKIPSWGSLMKANEVQVGGDHYRANGKYQIWDLVVDMGWDFFQGNVISYVHRYRQKGGVDDLRKARHYLDKMIEIEEAKKSEGEKS
jgi:hypothetical protein